MTRQQWAILARNKKKIAEMCPDVNEDSGIYLFERCGADGIRYAYVGQARNLLNRMAQHLNGYSSHIDRSIKKRGLKSEKHPDGWTCCVLTRCPENELDQKEIEYIRVFAADHQMLNATSGGQGVGKQALGEAKSPRGYRDGVAYGYDKAWREVSILFQKYLRVDIAGTPTKIKAKKLDNFCDTLYHYQQKGAKNDAETSE